MLSRGKHSQKSDGEKREKGKSNLEWDLLQRDINEMVRCSQMFVYIV